MARDLKFIVELRDYESGTVREITADRIERLIQKLLDKDVSDGYVIVALDEGEAI